MTPGSALADGDSAPPGDSPLAVPPDRFGVDVLRAALVLRPPSSSSESLSAMKSSTLLLALLAVAAAEGLLFVACVVLALPVVFARFLLFGLSSSSSSNASAVTGTETGV